MADPVTNTPKEAHVGAVTPERGAFRLLRRRDWVYVAVSARELGDAFQ